MYTGTHIHTYTSHNRNDKQSMFSDDKFNRRKNKMSRQCFIFFVYDITQTNQINKEENKMEIAY